MKAWLVLAVLTTAVASPLVVKRSEDLKRDLAADLNALQDKVVTAFSSLLDRFQTKVGFTATISKTVILAGRGKKVFLDKVDYNEGQAYDPVTGLFTAPVAGMYTFFIKTETDARNQAGLGVMKNGQRILYIYGLDSDGYETPSGQVVCYLAQGDRVWVESAHDGNNKIRIWTRFGGFLVQPDV